MSFKYYIEELKRIISEKSIYTDDGLEYGMAEKEVEVIETVLKELDKTCLHCGKDKPSYCENCYQELISENTKLQQKNKELTIFRNQHVIEPFTAVKLDEILAEKYIPKEVIKDKIEELGISDEDINIKYVLEELLKNDTK